MKKLFNFFLVMALFIAPSLLNAANIPTSPIRASVVDANTGEKLAGVSVSIYLVETGLVRSLVKTELTQSDGTAPMFNMEFNKTYRINASKAGYQTSVGPDFYFVKQNEFYNYVIALVPVSASTGGTGEATSGVGNATSMVCTDLPVDLSVGTRDNPPRNYVWQLQNYLTTTGDYRYFDGPTGYYGTVTRDAVTAFQARNGITADGITGVLTREKIKQFSCARSDRPADDHTSNVGQTINVGGNPNLSTTVFHTLTVAKTGTGLGVVTGGAGLSCGATCSVTVAAGANVFLTASPFSGSTFVGWVGCNTFSGNICMSTMGVSKTVTAIFNTTSSGGGSTSSGSSRSLSVSKNGTGTGIVYSPEAGIYCGSDCNESLNNGAVVTFVASPLAGSTFAGWSGSCSGSGSCSLVMNSNKNVTATFNTSGTSNTSGTGSGQVTNPYTRNAAVKVLNNNGVNVSGAKVIINEVQGQTSTKVSEQTTGGDGEIGYLPLKVGTYYNVSVIKDGYHNLVAGFTLPAGTSIYVYSIYLTPGQSAGGTNPDPNSNSNNSTLYKLTASKSGAGSGTIYSSEAGIYCGSDCVEDLPSGFMATFTAAPASGSTFGGWSGCNTSSGNTCTVTMSATKTISARFNTGTSPNILTPTVSVTAPSAGASYSAGSSQTVRWSTAGGTAANVIIFLKTAGGNYVNNGQWTVPNTGSANITMPTTAGQYQFEISANFGSVTNSGLSGVFTVTGGSNPTPPTPPAPTFNARFDVPLAGATWANGSNQYVSYTVTSSQSTNGANVKLELINSNGSVGATWTPANLTGNSGVTIVTAPNNPGTYRLRLTVSQNGSVIATTDSAEFSVFTLNVPTVSVSIPTSSTSWPAGSSQTVRWSTAGGTAANVIIFLKTASGSYVNNGQWTVPNTGSANITMPTTAGQYQFEISANFGSVTNSGLSGVFTVTAP